MQAARATVRGGTASGGVEHLGLDVLVVGASTGRAILLETIGRHSDFCKWYRAGCCKLEFEDGRSGREIRLRHRTARDQTIRLVPEP